AAGLAGGPRLHQPGDVGQVVAVGVADPGVAAELLGQHRSTDAGVGHHVLADLAEAEAAVEDAGRIAVVLDQDFAGQHRVAQLGIALDVGIDGAADAATAAAAGDHHAVDVHEFGMAR